MKVKIQYKELNSFFKLAVNKKDIFAKGISYKVCGERQQVVGFTRMAWSAQLKCIYAIARSVGINERNWRCVDACGAMILLASQRCGICLYIVTLSLWSALARWWGPQHERSMKMIRGLQHLSYESRQTELGLFSLGKGRLWGELAAFWYLKTIRKLEEGLLTWACSYRIRRNGFKLKEEGLDTRKKFFIMSCGCPLHKSGRGKLCWKEL